MPTTRAVLFDFGGTLYDYACLQAAEHESLLELAQTAGVAADPAAVVQAYGHALRRVFRAYVPRSFYLHRDLFRDAVVGMLDDLGVSADPALLAHYRAAQWERHARDFVLRDGVADTLAELRARGLHIGMVSNIDGDQLDHLLAISGLRAAFDSILSSEHAVSCKPHRAIYEEALRRAGSRPEEALFVGDTLLQDIAGANAVGLRSVLLWHRDDRDPPRDAPQPTHVIRNIPEVLRLLRP